MAMQDGSAAQPSPNSFPQREGGGTCCVEINIVLRGLSGERLLSVACPPTAAALALHRALKDRQDDAGREVLTTWRLALADGRPLPADASLLGVGLGDGDVVTAIRVPVAFPTRPAEVQGERFEVPPHITPGGELLAGGPAGCAVLCTYDEASPHVCGRTAELRKERDLLHSENAGRAWRVLREVRLLQAVKHDSVRRLVDIFPVPADSLDVYLAFEHMEADLAKILRSRCILNAAHCQWFLYRILVALRYLHSIDIAHGALTPACCLCNPNDELKLRDFSCTTRAGEVGADRKYLRPADPAAPCLWYRPPEALAEAFDAPLHGAGLDLWAVGCLLHELSSRRRLFQAFSYADAEPAHRSGLHLAQIAGLLRRPTDDELAPFDQRSRRALTGSKHLCAPAPLWEDEAARELARRLLAFGAGERGTAEEALGSPWFADVHDAASLEPLHGPLIDWASIEVPDGAGQQSLRGSFLDLGERFHPEVAMCR